MEIRKIGSLGVSTIGLGTNSFGKRLAEDLASSVIYGALDEGINFIDTADTYADTLSESYLGRALRHKREEVIIATKFQMPSERARSENTSKEYIRHSLEASLRRLNTDRVDLYILHWPDPNTPIIDILDAMDSLVMAGKVREIGCSNFTLEQIIEAEGSAKPGAARFVSIQNEYNLLSRDPELGILKKCAELGMGFVPHSPLAKGLLTGKYKRDEPPQRGTRLAGMPRVYNSKLLSKRNFDAMEALSLFAAECGHTLLELAISWLLAHSEVASVIAGAMSPSQIRVNVNAAAWTMTPDEVTEINKLAIAPN